MQTDIAKIQQDVTELIADREVMNALISTTFKRLSPMKVKEAIVEGVMRGFTFKDFLEKNVYAVPFGSGYTLVTSIDYSRKIGMRSGVVGVSAPIYTEKADGKIDTCTITVKRMVHGIVGDFTATVYFDEYNTGENLWRTKSRTMIAKVAEMHAQRMACPEEMSQMYVEEEFQKEAQLPETKIDIEPLKAKLLSAKNLEDLKSAWAVIPQGSITKESLASLSEIKQTMKEGFENSQEVEDKEPIIKV